MTAAITVYLKELRESLRDRRVLLNALLIGPLLGPILFTMILRLSLATELEKADKPVPVVVIGAERAPNLIEALKQPIDAVLIELHPQGALDGHSRLNFRTIDKPIVRGWMIWK